VQGDATALPFKDDEFDAATMGYAGVFLEEEKTLQSNPDIELVFLMVPFIPNT